MNYLTPEQLSPQTIPAEPRIDNESAQFQPDPVSDESPEDRKKRQRYEASPIKIFLDSITYTVPANDGSPNGWYLMPDLHFYRNINEAIEVWISRLPLSNQERLDAHEALFEELISKPELKVTLEKAGLSHPRAEEIRKITEHQHYLGWKRQEQERLDRIAREEAEAEEQRRSFQANYSEADEQLLAEHYAAEHRRQLRIEGKSQPLQEVRQRLIQTQQAATTEAQRLQERMAKVRAAKKVNTERM